MNIFIEAYPLVPSLLKLVYLSKLDTNTYIRQIWLSYWSTRLDRLAGSIPGLRKRLQIRALLCDSWQDWGMGVWRGGFRKDDIKGTLEWKFLWLRFWILYYFIVSYVKILRFSKKNFLIGPVLEEVLFFRVVLGLRGMKKIFKLGQKNIYLFIYLLTLYMS
jgi:hypothetical protein